MSKHKKYNITLSGHERETLENFVSDGKKSAREINRARILLLSDRQKRNREIAEILGISTRTVSSVSKKFSENKYESVTDFLREQPRSGRPVTIDTRMEANITAVACSDPPEGHAKWTLRMTADKVVSLEMAESVSHESVRTVLKKTD